MDSKWYIPPYKGKKKVNSHEDFILSHKDSEQNLINNSFGLKDHIEADHITQNQREHSRYQDQAEKLAKVLYDLKTEEQIIEKAWHDEKQKLTEELSALTTKKIEENSFVNNQARLQNQKKEITLIKNQIASVKHQIEIFSETEENLYFQFHETKKRLKNIREDYLKKEKEVQFYAQEYKNVSKEAYETQELLNNINKLERLKNDLVKEFIDLAIKKRIKIQENPQNVSVKSLNSKFRVLKLQIQGLDKEISNLSTQTRIRSNTVVSVSSQYNSSFN
jgi:hypothetical protein